MSLFAWRRSLFLLAFLILLIAAWDVQAAGTLRDAVAEHPITWTEYIRALWPVIVLVVGILITGVLLGLATKFTTTVAFETLKRRVIVLETQREDHEGRIKATETYCAGSPTRLDLQEDIADLAERIRAVEVGVTGLSKQGETTNQYLHTIIERGLK